MENDPTALEAATTVRTVRARVRHEGREYAEVAVPAAHGRRRDAPVGLPLRPARDGRARQAPASLRDGRGAADRARARLRASRRSMRAGSGACSGPPTGSPRARSTSRSSTTSTDEVGQLAASFDRMRLQLAQLDSARKEFVANASHELRTPLFSIAGFLELLDDEDLDETTRMEFLATTREPGRPPDEPRDRPARPLPAWTPGGSGSSTRRSGSPRSRAQVGGGPLRARRRLGPHAAARRRRRCLGARRRGADAADRPGARRQRARPHPGGHDGTAPRRAARRAGVALAVEDDGPGIPRRAPRPRLPALLPRRGRAGVGQRARARDRPRARGPDGRHGHGRRAGPARPCSRSSCRPTGAACAATRARARLSAAPFPRGNAAPCARGRDDEPRGYSDSVRAPVFAVAAVAAILGAGLALALGSLIGATTASTTTVVVQRTARPRPARAGRRRSRRSATASTRLRSTPAARRAS